MTHEEHMALSSKGGKKSVEVRRQKKKMRECLDILLSMPLKNRKECDIEEIKSFANLKGKNIDVQTAILIAQIQRALNGSVASAEFIRDTAGQSPEEIIKLDTENAEDTTLNINISYGKKKEETTESE